MADNLLAKVSNRMRPDMLSKILDIQDDIDSVLVGHVIFPDILGVPDGDLPLKRSGESSVPLKHAYESLAATESEKLLLAVAELLKMLC